LFFWHCVKIGTRTASVDHVQRRSVKNSLAQSTRVAWLQLRLDVVIVTTYFALVTNT
jgi:hypothetical protein